MGSVRRRASANPEEYRRALKRGTELFGHEMREIKTPRDYEEEEDSLIRILTKSNEEFMNAHDEKTPAKVYEEYERRYPELKHKDHAALVERYREDHGGKAPWEVVEEYKSAHPEQFPDE